MTKISYFFKQKRFTFFCITLLLVAVFLISAHVPSQASGTLTTVGYQTLSGSYDTGKNNEMSATKVTTASNSGTLQSISLYLGSVNATPKNHIQVALYSDNGSNAPGSRLISSSSQIATANAWNTFILNSVAIAPNTTYWLVFNTDGSKTKYAWATGTGTDKYKANTTFGTWPTNFGTPSSSDTTQRYAIYMTYQNASPTPTNTPTPTPTGSQMYVATTGSDTNSGTQASPYKTITKASTVATAGTTIHVAAGTYNGPLTTGTSGTSTAHIVYLSDTKWGAKIVDGAENGAAWRNDGNNVDINGFEFTGSDDDGILETGSNVNILNNHIYGFVNGNCLHTWNSAYDLTNVNVIGNVVSGCGTTSLDHGIYVGGPGGIIANNITYGNAGFGIQCWHNCNNITIANNLMFNNGQGGLVIGQGDAPNNGTVNANNCIVSNNIAINNQGNGLEEHGATGTNNQFLNNDVYGNTGGVGIYLQTGSQANTITTNAQFVNYQVNGSGDYHLQATSPDINTGTPTGAPATDLDGISRPQGTAVDIGPYEYH